MDTWLSILSIGIQTDDGYLKILPFAKGGLGGIL
jgi:hypothetical protein